MVYTINYFIFVLKLINKQKMEKTTFTPEESLLLISKTIQDTKKNFEENGFSFIFWGSLTLVASLSQFILAQLKYYELVGYPNILYPLGAIVALLFWKKIQKKNLPKTIIGRIIGAAAWFMAANLMILGPLFSKYLGEAIIPVFLIFLAQLVFISGIAIKYKPLIFGGVMLDLLAFSAFYAEWQYRFLIMAAGAVIALIIPGILLYKNQKSRNV